MLFFFIPTFFCFIGSVYAVDVTLAWSPNTEADVEGYKLYYKIGANGPPYNGVGATEGDAPIIIWTDELYNPTQPEFTIHGLNENETYYFVLTAYDVDGYESAYSEEVSFNSADYDPIAGINSNDLIGDGSSDGGGGGGCFIATAAYGSLMAPHVKILCQFRDRILLTNSFGKSFVDFYYKHSPSAANFIAEHGALRAMVRVTLVPVVGISWIALKMGPGPTVLLVLIFGIGLMALYRKGLKKPFKNNTIF
jgi:fibronectin type III domain protein